MHFGLIVALALLAWLVWFGLRAWERLVQIRREQSGGSWYGDGATEPRPASRSMTPRALPRDATWLAVRANDHAAVATALRVRTALPRHLADGLLVCMREGVLVTPSVDGWVHVIGRDVAALGRDPDRLERLLAAASDAFEAAAWFDCDVAEQRFGWVFAARGSIVRGYAYDDDRGHVYWHGDVTGDERELGCFIDDPRDGSDDEVKWWPDRATVLELARRWTCDPLRVAATGGVGLAGRL